MGKNIEERKKLKFKIFIDRIENLYWMALRPTAKELGLKFLLITLTLSHPLYSPPMYLSQFF